MRNLIIARKEEQRMLQNLKNERTAQFLAVYGRRRVGKTFLIREYFEDSFTFKHTALSPLELKDINPDALYKAQLAEFKKSLVRYGHKNDSQISDWFEAFDRLRELIESKNANERVIAFIDEMPWMDTPRAGFMSALEHFWNDYGSGKHNLLLIACGSATTWMLDKLIHNQGGLYGRTTKEMHIHPFTLSECEEYYKSRGVMMDRYDILQSYMILGGVAYYLSYIEKGRSLAQNIDSLFFSQGGKLEDEFDKLFTSLFGDNDKYRKIVEFLSKNRYGATQDEIAKAVGMSRGGSLSNMIKALVKSDLIISYYNFKGSNKEAYYKLTDLFCLFYLNFVRKHPTTNRTFWQDNQNSPKLNAWRGLAFEDVCFVHQNEIRSALGISGVHTEIYPWRSEEGTASKGAQIDMIIDRADRVINICEMKFSIGEFTIDKNYDSSLRNKIATVTELTKGKRNPQMTLITTYGLKENQYSGRIQRMVTMDDLFMRM